MSETMPRAPVARATAEAGTPELLRELADEVGRKLVEVGIEAPRAAAIGQTVAEHVRETYGGQVIYIPKGAALAVQRRRDEIYAAYDGTNINDLAHRFGMSAKQVYQNIALKRAEIRRNGPDLFGYDDPAQTRPAEG